MKPTLADYINREQREILQQQEAIDKIGKLFSELKSFYEKIDIEKSDESISVGESRPEKSAVVQNDCHSRRTSRCSSTHESAHILSGNPKGAGDKAEIRNRGSRGKFGASDEEEEKDTLQLLSLRGPRGIEVRSKAKSDHYRNDLLKQIEEKKRLKQLQDDREKAADEELQNRVAQQRLAMYMEYLEERKRGDLIVKAKTTGGAPEPTKRLPFTGGHHALFDLPEGHSRGTSQVESVFGKGTCRPKAQSDESPVPGKDLNILANLSEVRKLMHHDHVEMLEKLLELHIQ